MNFKSVRFFFPGSGLCPVIVYCPMGSIEGSPSQGLVFLDTFCLAHSPIRDPKAPRFCSYGGSTEDGG